MYKLPYILVNLFGLLLLAPILDGLERSIKAKLQNRRGPSPLQTWYDLIKLFKKNPGSTGTPRFLVRYSIYLSFTTLLIACIIMPSIVPYSYSFIGDIIVLVYLLISSKIFLILGSISSGNPYSLVGSSREVSLSMLAELIFAEIISVFAITNNSLLIEELFPAKIFKPSLICSLILLFFIGYVESTRLPFELGEAEPELSGGIMLEYTGLDLAFAYYSVLIRRIIYSTILINMIIPGNAFIHPILYLGCLLLLTIIYSFIEASFGRLRIDSALSILNKAVLIGGGIVVAAVLGF